MTTHSAPEPPANLSGTWIVAVAVGGPLPRLLDYRCTGDPPRPGCRVRVPLGTRITTGVAVTIGQHSTHTGALRELIEVIDTSPLLPGDVLRLLQWAVGYYHYPPGDGLLHGLPAPLRKGALVQREHAMRWLAGADASAGMQALRRAPAQAATLNLLRALPNGCDDNDCALLGLDRAALRALLARGLVSCEPVAAPAQFASYTPVALNDEQRVACAAVIDSLGHYEAFLLRGVTGSGKTEVYLQAIASVLQRGEQALVLVPEIALTPQTLARFLMRFPRTVVSHSGVGDNERAQIHLRCLGNEVDVLVGTRSAIFAPLPKLGLIVVDEEHDASFKQQEGFRYSARDLAIKRAQDLGIPVLLGSATPALESIYNTLRGRYRSLRLSQRPNGAQLPTLRIVDVRGESVEDGLSSRLRAAIAQRIAAGEQALVFLNRRGFAPTLACQACGWLAECSHCDARFTIHRQPPMLLCHHCGAQQAPPRRCPECGNSELQQRGLGTQRVEDALERAFPGTPVLRIDRDVARSKHRLEERFTAIHSGAPAILVGTQMLAKGHHFPAVTLSAVVNADGGLFSSDYRGPERTAQLIVQVAGRAGRESRPGEMWLQTCHPEHAVIAALARGGYEAFATLALREREAVGLPPFTALALLRAEAPSLAPAQRFLQLLSERAPKDANVFLRGPVPAPIERRADRHRAQLALFSRSRPALQRMLDAVLADAATLPHVRQIRFSVDVDPVDIY